ncbi:hypothetical protein KY342_03820, partial [Candidatus Woesearchaeota archaeon]|nr:hypothetical protein [Candidatus Woesearchaeota archaeon]
MVLRKFVFLVLIILLTTNVYAVTITTEPSELIFENVFINGYAEQIVKISSDRSEPVQVSLSATEPISSWVSFEPEAASVSKDYPAEFKVIVKPVSAQLGIYQGYMIINTVSEGNKFTTAVTTAFDVSTMVELTNKEIIQAVIKDIDIKAEQNSPIKVLVEVQNQGNVEITPFFQMDVLNLDKSQVLESGVTEKNRILPSSTYVIELDVLNNLALGSYWAEITLFLEDNWISGKQLIRFNVVEPGMVSLEESETIKVYPTPI